MKTYTFEVLQTRKYFVEVEADNGEDAREKAADTMTEFEHDVRVLDVMQELSISTSGVQEEDWDLKTVHENEDDMDEDIHEVTEGEKVTEN